MENPKNISRTFPLQRGSSQTHEAVRRFGFKGFFLSKKCILGLVFVYGD
jgi:hypothetical protein